MTQTLEALNHEVLEVMRENEKRLHEDIRSKVDDFFGECKKHDETRMRLRKAVALLVLSHKNISKAGKGGKVLSQQMMSFIRAVHPLSENPAQWITPQDIEWAEQVLAGMPLDVKSKEGPVCSSSLS